MLSFVVPVYKTPLNLLRNCLDSILRCTESMELICVLDSPGDVCEQVLDEYAVKDERVKVVKNDRNRGVSYSRNKGIDVAVGDFIAFVDSDDEIVSVIYEKGLDIVSHEHVDGIVFSTSEVVSERNGVAPNDLVIGTVRGNHAINIVGAYALAVYPAILRRALLIKNHIRFWDGHRFSEDYIFITQVLLSGASFAFLNAFGYKYIGHQLSTCRSVPCYERYLHGLRAVVFVLSKSLLSGVDENVICWHISVGLPMALFDYRAREYVRGRNKRRRYLSELALYLDILIRCSSLFRFPFLFLLYFARYCLRLWFLPFMPISQCMRFLCHYRLMLK